MEASSTDFPTPAEQIQLAKKYFAKVDAGDTDLLDMFADDAQAFFPKFGIAKGKAQIVELVVGLGTTVSEFFHGEDSMIFTQSGARVVVEGKESGTLATGEIFPGEARSGGLFCNVFEFRGTLISRLHIYADPDFIGKHNDIFPWGQAEDASGLAEPGRLLDEL